MVQAYVAGHAVSSGDPIAAGHVSDAFQAKNMLSVPLFNM